MASSIEELKKAYATSIEPGLVLVLVELKRLWDNDRAHFSVLHEWTYSQLGELFWGVHVAPCFGNISEDIVDEDLEDQTFNVPERYLQLIKNK
jgi:hypothetical protein